MSNDTCYLVIKFVGDENNWIHPISLNGRVIEAMYVDGVQVEPIRECDDLGGVDYSGKPVFHCSKCSCVMSLYDSEGINTLCTNFICDYPRFCPECGSKVVSANGE